MFAFGELRSSLRSAVTGVSYRANAPGGDGGNLTRDRDAAESREEW
jgi:hypothetical protein